MYAIIIDGGRQFRVQPGMELDIDFRDLAEGESVQFPKVLAVGGDNGLRLGTPILEGVSVTASVLGTSQDKKIYIQKFRRRKHSKKRTGHRQSNTRVRIEEIAGI